jgi:hypothetical protein
MADKVLAAATAFFLLGTLGLYGYAVNENPELLGYNSAVGSFVYVEGMVRQVKRGWGDELQAEIRPDGDRPPVWLQLDETMLSDQTVRSAALTGARVKAEGILERYKDILELRPANPDDLSILAPSSLNVVWDSASGLNNTSVAFRGIAFYKHISGSMLTMRIVDLGFPALEVNCSASGYKTMDERPHWENGTLVKVMGRLKYLASTAGPHIYLSGGAKGVVAGW